MGAPQRQPLVRALVQVASILSTSLLANQRGQAHLPNHELITVERQSLLERLSTRDRPSQSKSLSGREGGLAPAGSFASY